MEQIKNYIENNFNRYVDELKEFLKIPSISTYPENSNDIKICAEFVATNLKNAGMSKVEIFPTEGHPLVYAEWLGAPGQPTVLVYGHYDVQPPEPIELWETPPFEPTIKDGKIFARGATDDKGQLFTHIKSVEAYFKTNGSLPINLKFIIEGEEEIGSESLESFLIHHKDILKCDAVLISDTSLFAPGIPTITYGLRGISYFEIQINGPNRDLHSGDYGGVVGNPINILSQIISKLHNRNSKVTIPHFYDDVIKLTKKERDNYKKLKFSEKEFAKSIGVKELAGENNFSILERIWARPCLDCNGILGGFTGKGSKTIIPSSATAKISMRLVPNQDPKKISKYFSNYIKSLTPKSVSVKITELQSAFPTITPLNNKANIAAASAMEKAFGKKTVFIRDGGSIPVIASFSRLLKAPSVLMGFGLNSENLHSPNEHFNLTHFKLGILSSAYFIDEFSKG